MLFSMGLLFYYSCSFVFILALFFYCRFCFGAVLRESFVYIIYINNITQAAARLIKTEQGGKIEGVLAMP